MPTSRRREQPSEIRVVDENLRYGFAQVPRPVLRAKGLSMRAKLVYTMLLDYAWTNDYVFPGHDTMADALDISIDTVQRALKELRDFLLVDWRRPGLGHPNTYYILKISESKVDMSRYEQQPRNRNLRYQETADSKATETAKSGTKNTKQKKTKQGDLFKDKLLTNDDYRQSAEGMAGWAADLLPPAGDSDG